MVSFMVGSFPTFLLDFCSGSMQSVVYAIYTYYWVISPQTLYLGGRGEISGYINQPVLFCVCAERYNFMHVTLVVLSNIISSSDSPLPASTFTLHTVIWSISSMLHIILPREAVSLLQWRMQTLLPVYPITKATFMVCRLVNRAPVCPTWPFKHTLPSDPRRAERSWQVDGCACLHSSVVCSGGQGWPPCSQESHISEAAAAPSHPGSLFLHLRSAVFKFPAPPRCSNSRGGMTDIEPAGWYNDHVMWHLNPEIGVSLITGKWLSLAHAVHLSNWFSPSLCLCLSFVQIDKIMSSIGAGIGSGLDIKDETSGKPHTNEWIWLKG